MIILGAKVFSNELFKTSEHIHVMQNLIVLSTQSS